MSSANSIDNAIFALAEQFESHFREELPPIRQIGKEAEFPVVTRDGNAADVAALLQALLDEGGFTPQYDDPEKSELLVGVKREGLDIAMEVGSGTIELALQPCDDLWMLRREFELATWQISRVARARGMYLLGFGIQPLTRASLGLMTPRKHYRALYDAIGAPWLNFTTTAADQTHVDICRAELLVSINLMNLLSAPLIALCANSSVYAGRVGKFVAGRERELSELGETRYGMPPREFASTEELIRSLCEYECFVLPKNNGYEKFNSPFTNLLISHSPNLFSDFLWHEHYIWNSARARVAHSTIEVRPACQQPPHESLAANALILGWVESFGQIAVYFDESLGDAAWKMMQEYRRAVVRDGLQAEEPVPNMIRDLVEIAQAGLSTRQREEEKFLDPIWKRLEQRESPGTRAREVMRERGMQELVEQLALK